MLKYIRDVTKVKRDQGASAVEYGLMVAAIAAVIVGIVFALGTVVHNVFHQSCQQLSSPDGTVGNSTGTCP